VADDVHASMLPAKQPPLDAPFDLSLREAGDEHLLNGDPAVLPRGRLDDAQIRVPNLPLVLGDRASGGKTTYAVAFSPRTRRP
jgi:hypothetical protein